MTRGRATFRWAILGVLLCAAIIVPFVIWEDALVELSRHWLATGESRVFVMLIAVALLALDLVLPVPSSFVSAAVVAGVGPVPGALAIWTGMSAGAFAGYALGRSGGAAAVARFVGPAEHARVERLTERFGAAMLVVCRGVPVLAEASVVVAGAARLRFVTFAWVTCTANLGLAAAYALLTSAGWGGVASFLTPFALGVIVPGAAIAIARWTLRTRASSG